MVHSDAKSVSIPVQDMSALIARLEAAAGGSQALTDDTLRALGFFTKRYPMDSDRYWIVPGDERHPLPPWCDKITVSLDAALALAERVLPGWRVFGISDERGFQVNRGWGAGVGEETGPGIQHAKAPTPAVALCIAILKAKAQGEGNG